MAALAALAIAALAVAATACDVCSGLSLHEEPATEVILPATGDLSSCACAFVFAYSAGPTPGKVTLSATPGVGAINVYGDAEGMELIAELPESFLTGDVVIHSRTGTIRVDLQTTASPPPSASIRLSSTAVNAAPVLEERDDLEVYVDVARTVLLPWGAEGQPLPVTVRDYDNFDRGLRAELQIFVAENAFYPQIGMLIPAVPGVVFEVGAPDTVVREVVLSGPGRAVETAINTARLTPFGIGNVFRDLLYLAVEDLGNSGDGESQISEYSALLGVYPTGVIDVPRGVPHLNGGLFPAKDVSAVFLVHDAHRIEVVQLALDAASDGSCLEYLRVWDGSDLATARLLSTDLSLSGELCGDESVQLPSYEGTTGEFVVEYVAGQVANFDTVVSPTPTSFRAWLLDDRALQAAAGAAPRLLPQIMVTSLPDPTEIVVNITVSSGALSLRFADSFRDLVRVNDGNMLSLALEEQVAPAMLRMGDALRQVLFAVTKPGTVDVRVTASSGGIIAEAFEAEVEVVGVAINAPSTIEVHAFQPLPIAVSVDGASTLSAEVAVEGGLGLVSIDPRASLWIDMGYNASVVATGTAAEVNAALENLVYKATQGGPETILVRVGSVERVIQVTVDPDCDGAHFVYGREGTITERAGPPAEVHEIDINCRWFITGARELQFPYWGVTFGNAFLVNDASKTLYVFLFGPPGVLRAAPLPYFEVSYASLVTVSSGFVGVFQRSAAINDPPVIVVPDGVVRVLRGSTTRLRTLYVDDFTEGVIAASLETDAGWLQEEGTRRIEVAAETFEELDAWVTGIDFLAGDVQTTATLTLTATDDGGAGAEAMAQFQIEVLPCSGTAEVELGDAAAFVAIGDGSAAADYVDGLACGWRLTGAPAPAALDVAYLDLDCGGDRMTVYDGSSVAGRVLGSFCQADDVEAEVGTLVSSTGSFFLELVSDGDGAAGDGFSFVYGAVASGAATDLGPAPRTADPDRANATVIALGNGGLAVFGGHNGVRAVPTTLLFQVERGWRVLIGDDPTARSRAAGVAVSGSRIVVHGGVDIGGAVVAETWVGAIDGNAIVWTELPESRGPATAGAAMVVDGGVAHLVDASGVWILGIDDLWTKIGDTPQTVVATTSAYRPEDGLVYATGADGAVWTLSPLAGVWTPLGVEVDVECAPWTCSGAMLGPQEYVVGGSRVNVTSLVVDELAAAATGQTVGGQYLGQPSLFVYSSGTMAAVPLTLKVSAHSPLVSPVAGGTTISLSGEQLSTCALPTCEFGSGQAEVAVVSERTAMCTTPGGGAAVVTVSLVCADGRRYTSPDPFAYFAMPTIDAIDPASPDPGDTLLVTLGGIAADALALVDTPLCRFSGIEVAAALDGDQVRCRVPDATPRGTTVTFEISLDGQTVAGSAEIRVAKGQDPLFDKSRATIAGLGLAGVVAVVAVLLYVRTPNRPPRAAILSVAAGVVDIYFDVVFASKLRDEGSALAGWAFGSLVAVLVLNTLLVVSLVLRKTRLSSGRHAFVKWLGASNGAVVALSIACTLGIARVSALALLMTRMGGWAKFDADGMTAKDWHLLATLDLAGALAEDVSQLAIQAVYLSGSSAQVDLVTVVTVTLSTTMLVHAAFQGLARVLVLGSLGATLERSTGGRRVHALETVVGPPGGSMGS